MEIKITTKTIFDNFMYIHSADISNGEEIVLGYWEHQDPWVHIMFDETGLDYVEYTDRDDPTQLLYGFQLKELFPFVSEKFYEEAANLIHWHQENKDKVPELSKAHKIYEVDGKQIVEYSGFPRFTAEITFSSSSLIENIEFKDDVDLERVKSIWIRVLRETEEFIRNYKPGQS